MVIYYHKGRKKLGLKSKFDARNTVLSKSLDKMARNIIDNNFNINREDHSLNLES
jgi:hypothetical protein